ncbi:uncharacterized protein EV154DRAFT_522665 [Mucor mucedo]|uniref:uncharacterized protein n=1 Tax=Mucor mucedo TaxID=29922 RepID=UPI00221FB2E1|nr:uncharacterized protein EV154DRAFT_522665 [Mucor mucedo]KAI7883385.1 hypothetical protein EV154DRAFT_522665 [Mucor mucedo]
MISFFIRTLVIGAIAVILFKQNLIIWANQSLHKHFGVIVGNEFGFSYNKRKSDYPVMITLYNVNICRDHIIDSPGQRSVMETIPYLQGIVTRIVSGTTLRIKHLVLEKDNVNTTLHDVVIQPMRNPDLVIRVKTGPIQLSTQDAATGNITSDSFVTFTFKNKRLNDVEVRIGKATYDKPESVDLFAANARRWINSDIIRVTVDSIDFQGDSS